ncbi:MAG: YciI family protein [Thermoanaerobaculia bacterium]
MRFICLGYADESIFKEISEEQMKVFMEECFVYDDELRRGGHFVGGEALQPATTAVTLRSREGKVEVTDGPYIETKEYLGGILFLEARDLSHAIALMSKHPGVRFGPFEIRPADEQINELVKERDERIRAEDRGGKAKG